MEEYEQIQRLRELLSRQIMTWGQVLLPFGGAIIAFFVTRPNLNVGGLLIGWLLFFGCMVYWRWVVHHIDSQIVGMYPDMLRLDSVKGWQTQTRYYYNNLSKRSKDSLEDYIWKDASGQARDKAADYDTFKKTAEDRQKSHYELLQGTFHAHGRKSVTSRGHAVQDVAALFIVSLFLVIILWKELDSMALLVGFVLFLVLFLPLGWYLGWWEARQPKKYQG